MQQFEIYEQRVPYLHLNDSKIRPLLIIGEIQEDKIIGRAIYRRKRFWANIPGINDLVYHPYDTRLENLHPSSHIDISRVHKFPASDFKTKKPIGLLTQKDLYGINKKVARFDRLRKSCATQNPERIFDFLTLRDLYIHDQPIPGV